MNKTQMYLDQYKARNGGISDYRVAKNLGITPQAVSQWHTGKVSMNPTQAETVAKGAGLDPEIAVIETQIDRCKTPEEAAIWNRVLQRLGSGTAAAMMLFAIGFAPMDTQAAQPYPTGINPQHFLLCQIVG